VALMGGKIASFWVKNKNQTLEPILSGLKMYFLDRK
jgi:hypothetical protein